MLFLGIIPWKGVSCFNGGEGGVVFQMRGFIFKWVGALVLMGRGGVSKKIVGWGGAPTMGNLAHRTNEYRDWFCNSGTQLHSGHCQIDRLHSVRQGIGSGHVETAG